jgi:hypothetical protein
MKRIRAIAPIAILLSAALLFAFAPVNAEELAAASDELILDLAPLGEGELDGQRGGAEAIAEVVVVQESDLESNVNDNVVGDGVLTGAININDSFHDNGGISSSMINSGNNVSMQSSMTVNLYLD